MAETDNSNTEDPVARAKVLEAKAAERARRNRNMFPEMTKAIDMFKRAFGADQVRVLYVRENGHEMGTKLVDPPERTMLIRDMAFSTPKEAKTSKDRTKRARQKSR